MLTKKRHTPLRASLAVCMPVAGLFCAGVAHADAAPGAQRQITPAGTIITPSSSQPKPAGIAHTNIKIFLPRGRHARDAAPGGKFETPASLACVYGLTARVIGCNPETLTTVATTGAKLIALVDAYDDPTAANDLGVYSRQFGLPAITADNFQVVYGGKKKPAQDASGGWELEESLDIEMAHALAPNAKIVLVEAESSSIRDLLAAEKVATELVEAAGGGEVSNSWGGAEGKGEKVFEKYFAGTNVVYFASSGDSPGPAFPSVLPNVVAVGGTTLNRTPSGTLKSQTTWSTNGGGRSAYIATPHYQSAVTTIVGTQRGAPDLAAVGNPASGPWVYDTTPYSENGTPTVLDWLVIGGTSVASPAVAAMVNSAASFRASSTAELTALYAELGKKKAFTYVTGSCVNASGGQALAGYNLCAGIGAPVGPAGL